jgi:hypothetical protein
MPIPVAILVFTLDRAFEFRLDRQTDDLLGLGIASHRHEEMSDIVSLVRGRNLELVLESKGSLGPLGSGRALVGRALGPRGPRDERHDEEDL